MDLGYFAYLLWSIYRKSRSSCRARTRARFSSADFHCIARGRRRVWIHVGKMAVRGFGAGGETAAVYYAAREIGLGSRMHAWARSSIITHRDAIGALENAALKMFATTVYNNIYATLESGPRLSIGGRFRPDFLLITYWNIGALRKSPMLGERDVCSREVNEIFLFFPFYLTLLLSRRCDKLSWAANDRPSKLLRHSLYAYSASNEKIRIMYWKRALHYGRYISKRDESKYFADWIHELGLYVFLRG